MIIRPAIKAQDHKEICRIAKQTKWCKDFSNEVMFSNDKAYDQGWIRVLSTEGQEDVLGFYCIREKSRTPETTLYFLGVDESLRGQGYGQWLMRYLQRVTKHPTVTFNVEVDNVNARKFYEKLGCVQVGVSSKLNMATGVIEPKYWQYKWERKDAATLE